MSQTILVTDYAWPDLEIERQVIEAAGMTLVAGPANPVDARAVTELVQSHQPDSILTCWAQVNASAIAASQKLAHVGRIGVGLDNIDVEACTERGIPVTNVPDYCIEEVSDHALAMALSWARGVSLMDRDVRAGSWNPAAAKLRRFCTLTAGVIGYGRIGHATVNKFNALGCRVLVHSVPTPSHVEHAEIVDRETLLSTADIVIIHVPLLDATRGMVNREFLAGMKPGALLINVSRGGIVDTTSVIEALQSGHLGGAALDVLDTEPDVPAALLAHDNAIVTPHIAFSSDESLAELRRRAAEEAVRVLSGQPAQNPCNSPAHKD